MGTVGQTPVKYEGQRAREHKESLQATMRSWQLLKESIKDWVERSSVCTSVQFWESYPGLGVSLSKKWPIVLSCIRRVWSGFKTVSSSDFGLKQWGEAWLGQEWHSGSQTAWIQRCSPWQVMLKGELSHAPQSSYGLWLEWILFLKPQVTLR